VDNGVEVLTVNCPKLNTLNAYLIKDLRVNGILFNEISYTIWELNMQGGSNLIGLKMESNSDETYNFSAERFLEIVGSFKLLRVLVIFVGPLLKSEKEMDIPLLNVFERLPHLERLLEEDEYENPEYTYTEFLEKMLCLRRISPKARICKYSWFANILAKDRLQNDLSD
jgi:hypothetical protein